MIEKIEKLIVQNELISKEVWYEINELNKLDLNKFSAKEKQDILLSISNLEDEYQLRKLFLADLKDLL